MNLDAAWSAVHESGTDWGRSQPSDLVYRYARRLGPGAKVLDLGCGDGRNSILLARLGFHVTAVDVSSRAVATLRARSNEESLGRIDVIHADIREYYPMDGGYDLVLLYGVLNSIARLHWHSLLSRIRRATRGGGFNLVAFFTIYSSAESVDGFEVACLAEPGEILTHYRDWVSTSHDSRVEKHVHGLRSQHMHHIERVGFQNVPAKQGGGHAVRTISVVGPTNVAKASVASMVPAERFITAANRVAERIASSGQRLQCIPDGGVGLAAFSAYSRCRPAFRARVLAPQHDPDLSSRSPRRWVSELPYEADVVDQVTWEQQATMMLRSSDLVLVLGLSAGTVIEVLWAKWVRRPVLMSLDLCGRLPSDVRGEIDLFEMPTVDDMMDFALERALVP